MGAPVASLSFRPWPWSRRVEAMLGRIDGLDRHRLARFRRRVEGFDDGTLYLWAGLAGRRVVMVMLLSKRDIGYGPEILCEAAAGDLPGADLTRAAAAAVEAVAREAGCAGCMFDTRLPALARKTVLLGYELVEVRMRKVLA